jgi:cytochrome c-type biogenesis protein CcmH/NrfG
LNPSYAPTYRVLGDVYAKRGDTGKARGAYERYLKLAPKARDAGKVRAKLDAL